MALTFSWMDSLSLSYFLKTRRKSGTVLSATSVRPTPSTGSTKRKIQAILPPMMKAMTKAKTSMSGERIAVRMTIMYANWTLVTSVSCA